MNTPTPPTVSNGTSSTQAAAPTVGSLLGGAIGFVIVHALGITNPAEAATIALGATGAVTAFFHWLSLKWG
jgi:hypothetical protein